MQAYSLDLRQRIVQAYEQGQGSIPEIARAVQRQPCLCQQDAASVARHI